MIHPPVPVVNRDEVITLLKARGAVKSRGRASFGILIRQSGPRRCFLPAPQCPAPGKVGLTIDPGHIIAAHIRFGGMNGTDIPGSLYPAEKWTDRRVSTALRISQFDGRDIPEIIRCEVGSVDACTAAHEGRKVAKNVYPPVLHPAIEVHYRGCDPITKDLAAETALLTPFTCFPWILHEHSTCR